MLEMGLVVVLKVQVADLNFLPAIHPSDGLRAQTVNQLGNKNAAKCSYEPLEDIYSL